MPEEVERTPLAEDEAPGATALLIIDMLSNWKFPDADRLLESALPAAERIAALKARCRANRIPVIYANDNHGRWRSDFREVVAQARAEANGGGRIGDLLAPDADDYFVLKPKHSGFYATPLDLLLRHLRACKLVVTGVASDQCVLYTAADARMRDYEVTVPRDCSATQSAERHEQALRHFEGALCVATTASADLELPRPE
ncbi:cysteine hydrolase family protein [Piscinibacter koreensis]|uniref:Cysteine hydrolase n=1 Tax=Piscinibacter koreensis TaxID=2742824 RepID=A0A7Y6TWH3_9BURK|nr:isochorismatase family cysteine hydrolase [Schlegelella koreensis]NUZ06017.1 cysteine hydrolase [Schlegelella koreensis]